MARSPLRAHGAAGLLLGVLLLACTDQGPALGQPFELAIGQPVTVAETGLLVTLQAVTEDSRCPTQVQCIWAGRYTVELALNAPNEAPETVSLSSCCAPAQPSHYEYAGQAIDLVGLEPTRQRPEDTIAEADYRAQVTVTTL